MVNLDPTSTPATTEYDTVHVVFKLSKAKWAG